ncbi:alpha-amylase family glycosyl hydrolase [uncultured Bacteroides sp.]|uniref:alpha-amylase family glycosyl hydrolase n=1 Tax=uncultured Bacteroides sp. TaxID=162156 RepID=UPI0025E3000B|nr:alpha-amylase family glycosyl hydrolase [uncultured Bacteroides sp.]
MKKYFIYLLLLLFTVPYISSCSDEWTDADKLNLLTKEKEEEPIVEDDIDVNLLKFGFNLNPKAETDELPNADEALDIYFYAEGKEITDDEKECPLLGYEEACYLHTGVYSEGTWMYVPAAWTENINKCKMSRVKENVWKITLSPSIRDWFGSGSTPIQQLGLIIRTAAGVKGIEEDTFVDIEDEKYNGFTPGEIQFAPMPSGLQHGINIIDNSTVTLVLYEKDNTGARYYDYAYVMGDFNNWKRSNDENSQMFYDEQNGCWWITLSGLDATKEYAFQYYLGKSSGVEGEKDTELRIADPYSEKILDASSDSYIPESTYPSSQRIYPSKGAGTVSVFKIRKDSYAWTHDDFAIADKNNLMIYELLLRDFTESGDLQGALQKLDYLKNLGVTAIELMPVQEFEGNDSWGYNPTFYFALDKAYGTSDMYKKFIDECHKRDIAVLFDVVYNHATGNNTFARLYWDSENNKTATNNPWFNTDAPHDYSVFHDFNHESPLVRDFVKRNLKYLIDEYHIDGFRFDLTKGFTQNVGGSYDASAYDESRISILRDYYNAIQSVSPEAVMICEHWADWAEENVLALAGIQCWHKGSNTHDEGYYQSGMGWAQNSSFANLIQKDGNSIHFGGWVGFMESHDEERVAYKAKTFGNGDIGSDLTTRMNQLAANAAFCFTVPGPKMIWQFGELGYDETLGSEANKTSKKPLHWEYYDEPARRNLYNIYAKLLNLRKTHADLFGKNASFSWNVTENRWTESTPRIINLKYNDKELIVVGNFGDQTTTYSLNSNIKYNYISGENVSGSNVIVEPHNFFLGTSFQP